MLILVVIDEYFVVLRTIESNKYLKIDRARFLEKKKASLTNEKSVLLAHKQISSQYRFLIKMMLSSR